MTVSRTKSIEIDPIAAEGWVTVSRTKSIRLSDCIPTSKRIPVLGLEMGLMILCKML